MTSGTRVSSRRPAPGNQREVDTRVVDLPFYMRYVVENIIVSLFLLTFLLLYGGLHFYFFLKVRAAFAPGAAVQAILVTLLVLGLMAPIIVRVAERLGLEMLVRFVAWTGYVWISSLRLCSSISIVFSCMPPALSSARISPDFSRPPGCSSTCRSPWR